jgi:hypothetical protein
MNIRRRCSVLLLGLVFTVLGLVGCADYYSDYPGYGPYYAGGGGPYYAASGGPYYAGGGAPYYANGPYYGGNYPASVAIAVGDRPYYTHGGGYYVGRSYYVWKPGRWRVRNGQRVWVHGNYVVRGY